MALPYVGEAAFQAPQEVAHELNRGGVRLPAGALQELLQREAHHFRPSAPHLPSGPLQPARQRSRQAERQLPFHQSIALPVHFFRPSHRPVPIGNATGDPRRIFEPAARPEPRIGRCNAMKCCAVQSYHTQSRAST